MFEQIAGLQRLSLYKNKLFPFLLIIILFSPPPKKKHFIYILGYTFPALKEADAMFVAEKAPEWKDGECCTRCRVVFGVVQRKVCLLDIFFKLLYFSLF